MRSLKSLSTGTNANGVSDKANMEENYDLINSIFREENFGHVLDPLGISPTKFGGTATPMQNYNIIRSRLETLKGEEMNSPIDFFAHAISGDAVSEKAKERHQLFIEPEGKSTVEMNLNGFSTSLPEEVQLKALRKIKGLEKVKLFRAGYAIEYDYFPPTQLKHSLETKLIKNLFFTGQINGTTGYEEAAAQGLIAGINAHQTVANKEVFILSRSDAYIGVLIDDLITKGTKEPYRMFTSRAEFRLLLRQDNADIRLTRKGYNIGLANKERLERLLSKEVQTKGLIKFLETTSVDLKSINPILKKNNSSLLKLKVKFKSIISRPHISINDLLKIKEISNYLEDKSLLPEAVEQAEIEIKYGGYLSKEKKSAEKVMRLENIKIPADFQFDRLHSISTEGREKLKLIKPNTIGQASRISGVSPSDINILLIYMGR